MCLVHVNRLQCFVLLNKCERFYHWKCELKPQDYECVKRNSYRQKHDERFFHNDDQNLDLAV